MPTSRIAPKHLRAPREKVFGEGNPLPLDGNAKARIIALARSLVRKTAPGLHYGQITAKALDVCNALLWGFHNAHTGLCFPSYEVIAEKAGCARSTVAEAIHQLEHAGLLTWVNRIARIRVNGVDLFGRKVTGLKLIRTSNAYQFNDPGARKHQPAQGIKRRARPILSPKSESRSGTADQELFISYEERIAAGNALQKINKEREKVLHANWLSRLSQPTTV